MRQDTAERGFSVEMKDRKHISSLTLDEDPRERVLIEGSIGQLTDFGWNDEAVLTIEGEKVRAERGALATLAVTTAWSLASTAYHLTEPVDLDRTGLTGLLGALIIGVALIPFYLRENTWGYLAGAVLNTAIIAAGVNAVLERSYFYSASIYNTSVLVLYAASITGLALSYRSFRRSGRQGWRKTLTAVIGVVALAASLMYPIHANYDAVTVFRAQRIQSGINAELSQLETTDQKIAYLVEKGGIPSMVVGIVVDDEVRYIEAFGDATKETAYSCGSVTKMFTATAVMKLCEMGEIDLDADVGDYLPFEVRHPSFPGTPITIRHLLSHQTGLGSLMIVEEAYLRGDSQTLWLSEVHGWEISPVEPYPTLLEYLEGLVTLGGTYHTDSVWSAVEPGTEHVYSNTNYVLLTAVIEQVSGMRYDDYMEEHVLTPFGMDDSVFDYREVKGVYATGHEREYEVLSKTNLPVPDYTKVPGPGGLISTVEDLSRFMIAQLNEGENPVLAAESVSLMHRKAVDGGGHINKEGYGLGFTHLSQGEWQYYGEYYGLDGAIGHEGGQIGYAGSFYLVNDESGGYGIIVLSNLSTIENGVDFSWYFPVYYKIQTLLMEEARSLSEENLAQKSAL